MSSCGAVLHHDPRVTPPNDTRPPIVANTPGHSGVWIGKAAHNAHTGTGGSTLRGFECVLLIQVSVFSKVSGSVPGSQLVSADSVWDRATRTSGSRGSAVKLTKNARSAELA